MRYCHHCHYPRHTNSCGYRGNVAPSTPASEDRSWCRSPSADSTVENNPASVGGNDPTTTTREAVLGAVVGAASWTWWHRRSPQQCRIAKSHLLLHRWRRGARSPPPCRCNRRCRRRSRHRHCADRCGGYCCYCGDDVDQGCCCRVRGHCGYCCSQHWTQRCPHSSQHYYSVHSSSQSCKRSCRCWRLCSCCGCCRTPIRCSFHRDMMSRCD
mmetsp:Transcript_605/g.1474  ORF Transcript_605/g.1474 Transcript_605/m.1474 type:complete len:212 (-) Transcript_605:928-1563(-)